MNKYCDYNDDWYVDEFIDEWNKWNEYRFQLYLNLPNINFYKLCKDDAAVKFEIGQDQVT